MELLSHSPPTHLRKSTAQPTHHCVLSSTKPQERNQLESIQREQQQQTPKQQQQNLQNKQTKVKIKGGKTDPQRKMVKAEVRVTEIGIRRDMATICRHLKDKCSSRSLVK